VKTLKAWCLLALAWPVLSIACDAHKIAFSKGYIPLPAPGQPVAAVYIEIKNEGDKPITLESISSPVAEHVMLHQNVHTAHHVKMKSLETLVLPSHQTVHLKPGPGNMHIMLMGLKQSLKVGDTVTLYVTFGDASEAEVYGIPVIAAHHGAL
jgi:copper(I)-binding protein